MRITAEKISGAGNTFILIEEGSLLHDLDSVRLAAARLAAEICDERHPHGGADGVIIVGPDGTSDFRMDFYNRDGSTGMMCGNGGRCAVRFAIDHGYVAASDAVSFRNAGVLYRATTTGRGIRLDFPDPRSIRLNEAIDLDGIPCIVHHLDVGTPHLILFLGDGDGGALGPLHDLDIERWGPLLRHHPFAGPGGANANIAALRPDRSGVDLRTFERGVEGETGACGTGAIAVGIAAALLYDLPRPITIVPTSGSPLHVGCAIDEAGGVTAVSLEGGAEVVWRGEIGIRDKGVGSRE